MKDLFEILADAQHSDNLRRKTHQEPQLDEEDNAHYEMISAIRMYAEIAGMTKCMEEASKVIFQYDDLTKGEKEKVREDEKSAMRWDLEH